MYSILISDSNNSKWKFLLNTDGTQQVAETLVAIQEKVKEVLRTTPLSEILVVKNCTITDRITVTEDVPVPDNSEEENENTGEAENTGE